MQEGEVLQAAEVQEVPLLLRPLVRWLRKLRWLRSDLCWLV